MDRTMEATSTPMTDSAELDALAAAARAGEPGAFDLLARRLARRLMAFAYRTLRDRPLAEEAVQESLVRIYRFLPRYRDGNFLAWCFTITHRVCTDIARKERRGARVHVVPDLASEHDPIEAADVRAAVEQALGTLPEHLRTTFLLHQQGLTYEDVAQIVGTPVGTVRSRMFEARRLLRARLSSTFQGESTA